jgi:hypothetical protein
VKLRTLDELETAIDRETAWRKRELTTILFQASSARERIRPTAIRGAVALLYAHWEGWIKRLSEYYIEFVAQRRLPYDQLSAAFLGLALKGKLNEMSAARAVHAHVEFVEFMRNELGAASRFRSRTVDTRANLSSRVLRDIVARLGLSYRPYELQEQLIDKRLVERRNTIAHGEYLDMSLPEFEQLHSEVFRLLETFTTDVLNAVASSAYRAP